MARDDLSEVDRSNSDETRPGVVNSQDILRSAITTAAAGVAHALLVLIAFWLMKSRTPGAGAPEDEIIAYYTDPNHRRMVLIAGTYLIPFAGIAFIWFIVALRAWVIQVASNVDVLRSNVLLVCGVIYITLIFSAGASMSVLATSMELGGQSSDPLLSRTFLLYGTSLFLVFALRMASMVVTTMTSIGRKTGILPVWLQLAGICVAIAMLLVSTFNSWFVVVFPIWLLLFSIFMLRRAWELHKDAGILAGSGGSNIDSLDRQFARGAAERQRNVEG